MNKMELAIIALVVLAFIFVAVIATSDISSLIIDPDDTRLKYKGV